MFAIVAIIALGKLDSPTQERVPLPIEKKKEREDGLGCSKREGA